MPKVKPDISIAEFNYELDNERIAKFPVENRDSAKLLVYNAGHISESTFCKLPEFLAPSSLLVFNNTKVIHARLLFKKESGARIEIFCLEPLMPNTAEQALSCYQECSWACAVGNLKKWKAEVLQLSYPCGNGSGTLYAKKVEVGSSSVAVHFSWDTNHSFGQLMEICGMLPIPPYLKREAEASDTKRYQTVYAKHEGSVAAPTAGLHFTNSVFEQLTKNGIELDELTLHVGAGTFKPVKAATINQHEMHSERFSVSRKAVEHIIRKLKNGKLIAVGTTSTRTLESLYYVGVQALLKKPVPSSIFTVGQWEPYENEPLDISPIEALNAIIGYLDSCKCDSLEASTSIMIAPGYKFKLIDGLVTNFHQPQSTLLLLIAALIGDDWKRVYGYALEHSFRFLSYGDSSLLLPK